MYSQKFSVRSRIKSFSYAISGISQFIRREHNAWIHALATIAVVIAAFVLGVSHSEALTLVLVIGMVWITEILNTCLERMADFVSPQEHPEIKFIKDLAAGAVLVAASISVIAGLFIFIPKII